jgi:hypothetical protein
MVNAQLELVYGLPSPSGDSSKKIAMFPVLGAALTSKELTGTQFAAAAQRGYGPLYAKEFPGWYSSVRALLARVLEPAAAGLDPDAASWGKAVAASLPAIR